MQFCIATCLIKTHARSNQADSIRRRIGLCLMSTDGNVNVAGLLRASHRLYVGSVFLCTLCRRVGEGRRRRQRKYRSNHHSDDRYWHTYLPRCPKGLISPSFIDIERSALSASGCDVKDVAPSVAGLDGPWKPPPITRKLDSLPRAPTPCGTASQERTARLGLGTVSANRDQGSCPRSNLPYRERRWVRGNPLAASLPEC
jgi:hypothetical protein